MASPRFRSDRLQIIGMFLYLAIGLLMTSWRQLISALFHVSEQAVLAIGAGFVLVGSAMALLLYLRGSIRLPFLESFISPGTESREVERQARLIWSRLDTLQNQVEHLERPSARRAQTVLSESERNQVIAETMKIVSTSATRPGLDPPPVATPRSLSPR